MLAKGNRQDYGSELHADEQLRHRLSTAGETTATRVESAPRRFKVCLREKQITQVSKAILEWLSAHQLIELCPQPGGAGGAGADADEPPKAGDFPGPQNSVLLKFWSYYYYLNQLFADARLGG